MNPIIDAQFSKIVENYKGSTIQNLPNGTSLVQVPEVNLPDGWNQKQTTIWFLIPQGYPVAKPDCFWADRDLRLKNGTMPMNTSHTPMPNGTTELWFSWHSAKWNPNTDELLTYLHMTKTRLRELR